MSRDCINKGWASQHHSTACTCSLVPNSPFFGSHSFDEVVEKNCVNTAPTFGSKCNCPRPRSLPDMKACGNGRC